MFLENNLIIKKLKEITKKTEEKGKEFFSNKYFTAFLFVYIFAYLFFYSHLENFVMLEKFYLSLFSLVISGIAVYLMFKINKLTPFVVSFGGILIFFSFFWQRFELIVEYNLMYYLGFGLIAAAVVYSLIKGEKKLLWISMFILFIATLSPLLMPQILIGDERILLDNLGKLESGEFTYKDFGENNYVNVSFVYFYYLVIIAKLFGTTVFNIFFLFKFFLILMIFLSFYLLSSIFLNEKLAVFAVLIAFFPIQNIHLAPQTIGKFVIFFVFIYFYLKYFNQLNSRIILVVMMLIITYINLTTLYISVAVFGFFVLFFFFKKVSSKKTYYTDIAIFLLFGILVATYSTSINLFDLAGSYSEFGNEFKPIIDLNQNENLIQSEQKTVLREEELNPKANPFNELELDESGTKKEFISGKAFEKIPFVRRFIEFVNNYVNQFGVEQLMQKLIYYSLVGILVLASFFLFPKKRKIFVLSMALVTLILFLIHIQFQDGVHATLEVTGFILGVCIVLIFNKKPLYFIPILLLVFSSASAVTLFSNSQYTEANELFSLEFSANNIIGEKLTPITIANSVNSNNYANDFGFSISCIKGKAFDFYLNNVYLRCDDNARIGSIGKKVYENKYSKVYVIKAQELIKFKE